MGDPVTVGLGASGRQRCGPVGGVGTSYGSFRAVVGVRVRPPLSHETLAGDPLDAVTVKDGKPSAVTVNTSDLPSVFAVDHVFAPGAAGGCQDVASTIREPDQSQVYEKLCVGMLSAALNGISGCVLTCGGSGSGKSYSILCCGKEPGLIPHATAELCKGLAVGDPQGVRAWCSYYEVGSDSLRDLLSPLPNSVDSLDDGRAVGGGSGTSDGCGKTSTPAPLRPFETLAGIFVPRLTECPVQNIGDVQQVIEYGMRRRAVSSHQLRAVCRTHTVFSIRVERPTGPGTPGLVEAAAASSTVFRGRLSFVDVAARRRLWRCDSALSTLDPGVIDAALDRDSALAELEAVIAGLPDSMGLLSGLGEGGGIAFGGGYRRDGGRGASGGLAKVVHSRRRPFLTRLVADSLRGDARLAILATVGPARADIAQTLTTLRFTHAVRKAPPGHGRAAVVVPAMEARELVEELRQLRYQLEQALVADPVSLNRLPPSAIATVTAEAAALLADEESMQQEVGRLQSPHLEQRELEAARLHRAHAASLRGVGLDSRGLQSSTGSTPLLVNISDDPMLSSCLVYGLEPNCPTTIGSSIVNVILLQGLGMSPRHCTICAPGAVTSPSGGGGCGNAIGTGQHTHVQHVGSRQQLGDRNSAFPPLQVSNDDPPRNRVLVNGRPVSQQPCALRDRDRLVLGWAHSLRVVAPPQHGIGDISSDCVAERGSCEVFPGGPPHGAIGMRRVSDPFSRSATFEACDEECQKSSDGANDGGELSLCLSEADKIPGPALAAARHKFQEFRAEPWIGGGSFAEALGALCSLVDEANVISSELHPEAGLHLDVCPFSGSSCAGDHGAWWGTVSSIVVRLIAEPDVGSCRARGGVVPSRRVVALWTVSKFRARLQRMRSLYDNRCFGGCGFRGRSDDSLLDPFLDLSISELRRRAATAQRLQRTCGVARPSPRPQKLRDSALVHEDDVLTFCEGIAQFGGSVETPIVSLDSRNSCGASVAPMLLASTSSSDAQRTVAKSIVARGDSDQGLLASGSDGGLKGTATTVDSSDVCSVDTRCCESGLGGEGHFDAICETSKTVVTEAASTMQLVRTGSAPALQIDVPTTLTSTINSSSSCNARSLGGRNSSQSPARKGSACRPRSGAISGQEGSLSAVPASARPPPQTLQHHGRRSGRASTPLATNRCSPPGQSVGAAPGAAVDQLTRSARASGSAAMVQAPSHGDRPASPLLRSGSPSRHRGTAGATSRRCSGTGRRVGSSYTTPAAASNTTSGNVGGVTTSKAKPPAGGGGSVVACPGGGSVGGKSGWGGGGGGGGVGGSGTSCAESNADSSPPASASAPVASSSVATFPASLSVDQTIANLEAENARLNQIRKLLEEQVKSQSDLLSHFVPPETSIALDNSFASVAAAASAAAVSRAFAAAKATSSKDHSLVND